MRIGGGEGKRPKVGAVVERARFDTIQYAIRHADIGEQGLTAQIAPGQQQMAWFQSEKGDGQRRPGGESSYHAGRSVQAARNVHGDKPARCPQRRGQVLVEVPAQARPKNGVDHEVRAGDFL
jgi:hypothetical protein